MCQPDLKPTKSISLYIARQARKEREKKEFYKKYPHIKGGWHGWLKKSDIHPVMMRCQTLREAVEGVRDIKLAQQRITAPLPSYLQVK